MGDRKEEPPAQGAVPTPSAGSRRPQTPCPFAYFGLAKAEDIQPRAPFSSSTSIQTPLRWPVG